MNDNLKIDDKQFRRFMGSSCACFNLRRATRLVTQKYDHALRDSGLTANQFSLMMSVYDQGSVTMSRLAKILGMERTTLTRNAGLLERMGCVEITQGKDKRERRIMVTAKGKRILERIVPIWQKTQEEMIELMGDKNWGNLISGLHSVFKAL